MPPQGRPDDGSGADPGAVAMLRVRQDSTLADANDAAVELLGFPRESLLAMSLPDLDTRLEPASWPQRWQHLKTCGCASVETDLRHGGGETIPVDLILTFDGSDGDGSVCAFARDIRPSKSMEHELKQAGELFRALMENTLDLVTILDAQGVIQYANPAMERLLGFAVSERLNVFAFDLVHPEDLPGVLAEFTDVARTRRFGSVMEVRLLHKSGEWVYFDAVATNLLDNPAVRGIVIHSRDVTDRKRTELALKQSEAELRALAGRLIQGEEDEARLLARELHDDFNQRLTAISLVLRELERHCTLAVSGTCCDRHGRLQSMVEAISEDMRRVAHRLHPAVIDLLGLSAALKQLCDETPTSGGPAVHFLARRGCDCPVDRAQSLCLYRVAQEALRNAIRHSGARDVWIELAGSSGLVRLTVRDNGAGFDGDAAVRGGLGLISMKERVRLAGGNLKVDSRPGQGTKLSATVPISVPGSDSR